MLAIHLFIRRGNGQDWLTNKSGAAGEQTNQAAKGDEGKEEEYLSMPQEMDRQTVTKQMSLLSERLSSFESDGLSDILDELEQYQYHEKPLRELTDEIRRLTEDFDFIGASEALDAWQKNLARKGQDNSNDQKGTDFYTGTV